MNVKHADAESERASATEKPTDTRLRILRAALQTFSEVGFEGASIRSIGDAAGVGFQTIHYHFSNKEELWVESVLAATGETGNAIRAGAIAFDLLPPEDKLKAKIQTLVRLTAQHPDLTRAVFREAMKDSPRYHRVFDQTSLGLFNELRDTLKEAQSDGVIKANIDLEYLIFIVHGAMFTRVLAPAEAERITGNSMSNSAVVDKHAQTIIELLLCS